LGKDDVSFGYRLRLFSLAFALGQPGFGPARIRAELAREKWGGLRISHRAPSRV